MPELLIMRHAKSAWDTNAASDFDRPLADRGLRDRVRMADWLLDTGLVPDAVLSSSARRARSTAEQVVESCGVAAAAVSYDDDLYGAWASHWIERIRATHDEVERLLVCGHNPGLDDLVATLASTEPELTDSGKLMTTAAIAHLRFDEPWHAMPISGCTLVTVQRPRDL